MGIYNGFKFHPLVVLRTPRSPLCTEVNEEIVLKYFRNFANQEAIFLASPQLYNRLLSKQIDGFTTSKEDRKLLYAITKYFIRSHGRATPFGLFAGLSVVPWGSETSIKLNPKIERHTRLDMSLLCMLANKLISISKIAERLTFYKNTSLYKINSDFRYVEYLYQKSRRIHQISSIKADKYLNKTLKFISKKGAKFNEIANNLIDNEVNEEIAMDFVFQLIQNQILYSELEPEISGREYIFQIIEVLHSINQDNDTEIGFFIYTLEEINKQIEFLDQSIENKVDRYYKILDLIKSLDLDFDENTMFQTDMVALLESECQIAESNQKILAETIDFLQKINLNDNDQNLNQFCEKFTERYQEQEVPLTLALDIENGIGYLEKKHGDYKPLIEDITFHNQQNNSINLNVNQQKIYKALIDANRNHTYEINLKEIDFETSHSKNMPTSFNVLFKELEAGNIQIEAIGGSSAATLLGRFGYVHNQICDIIQDAISEEEKLINQVIFAEILHLPEHKTGNVIMHPRYRKYEIPFLAKSGLEGKNKIEISDLMVSVVNNQVILRSKKLNKIVLPRLSNAHNYAADALPIYQFLCDIQYQNVYQYLNFDWGKIGTGFNFLPRVSYHNTVLMPAQWVYSKTELKEIATTNDLLTFFCKNKIPQKIWFVEGDNELLIDISQHLMIDILLDLIKKVDQIILKEFLAYSKNILNCTETKPFAHQMVATLINTKPLKIQNPSKVISKKDRNFVLGSRWIYFKLYCGAKVADEVLANHIYKIVQKATKDGMINGWFFIRYNDPEPHIRLRFLLANPQKLEQIIFLVKNELHSLLVNNIIWKYQTDTYERELERYGGSIIEFHENLFQAGSLATIQFLRNTLGDIREQLRWLFALKMIDITLDLIQLNNNQKQAFMHQLMESFYNEFNLLKDQKMVIDQKFRDNKTLIIDFMESAQNQFVSIFNNYINNAKEPIKCIIKYSEKLDFESVMGSQIHMLINRLVNSSSREHELVIYDFLYRYYKYRNAMEKK